MKKRCMWACEWDGFEFPEATPAFSSFSNLMSIVQSQRRCKYFRFGCRYIRFFNAGPWKCRFSRRNFVYVSPRSWYISISGLEAAILDFPLPVWSDSIWTCPILMLDLKSVGLAVGISFLSHLEADLLLVPFRRLPSWVFQFRFRPALVPLVPLTCHNNVRVAAEIVYLASIEAKISLWIYVDSISKKRNEMA